jgi:Cu+-exporting ATPase
MDETERKTFKMVKDPVCGMVVNPAKAVVTLEYKGETYHFCSNFCAELFDPEMTEAELTRLRAAILAKDPIDEAIDKLIRGLSQILGRPGGTGGVPPNPPRRRCPKI